MYMAAAKKIRKKIPKAMRSGQSISVMDAPFKVSGRLASPISISRKNLSDLAAHTEMSGLGKVYIHSA